jgi:acyl-CoA thioesterase
VPFEEDTGLAPIADGRWEGAVAEGWSTPRGPLGGYIMAIVMRGLELAVGDAERQARSVTMHFLRPPQPGPVTVSAEVERTGRSLTTVTGRLEQDEKLLGLAIAAYSKPYESPLLDELPMPVVAAPDGSVITGPGGESRVPPEFAKRLTMEPRFGDPFFTRSDHGETGGWLGLREDRPIDSLAVAVLADAWFPAPWPRLSGLAPAPTIDLTVHFRSPLPVRGPLLLGRFNSRHVRDGFFEEDGVLWAPDGTLVAQSRQLGLLFGAQV